MNKKFAPILPIVVLAALVAGLTYWRGQTQPTLPSQPPAIDTQNQSIQPQSTPDTAPVSTADWKTFSNEKYNFEFKYPSAWRLVGEKNDFNVRFEPNNGRYASFNIWSGETTAHGAEGVGPLCRSEKIKIAGIDSSFEVNCGRRNLDTNVVAGEERFYFAGFTRQNIEYLFEFYIDSSQYYSLEKEVLDQIFSTFKFIK